MKKIIATFLMLLICISGCGTRENSAGAWEVLSNKFDDSIFIGVVGTMWIMEDASKYLDGVRLAVEEINAEGGINNRDIKILELDDKAQTMEGIKIAQKLVEEPKVSAVIGHWDSHVTVPAASIYENAGVLMMTAMATSSKLTQNGYKYIFRNIPSDDKMGEEMATFAGEQGLKRIAIYYSDTDYGRGLANAFEKVAQGEDVKIVDRTTYFINEDDFERTMERWKAFDFDGVFIADYMPDAGSVIKRIRDVYPDIPIMGTDGLDSPDFIDVLGDAAEGIVLATLLDPETDNPELIQFINNFKKRYNDEPDVYAVQGYETVKLLSAAMKATEKLTPEQIAEVLRAIEQWPGLTGTLKVEENGDVTGKIIHKKVVRNGKFEYIPIP